MNLLDETTHHGKTAGRFDRALDDLFDIEIEIARQVVAAIEPTLESHEMRRVIGRPPETLTAYQGLGTE